MFPLIYNHPCKAESETLIVSLYVSPQTDWKLSMELSCPLACFRLS